ncbi:hypothetical protein GE061_008321 [Apolygus lucorum]|uniref:Uncharacterized protein n=1 Tax=Apolygus lucorum TaxID=248454 RepID=A0A8S9WPK1_APOLU|nr:hypothetical protein GE061_008321 [Apolygus lucorum]
MGKCNEDEVKKCKKLMKKCEKKDKVCSCGKKLEKEVKKDPRIYKEDMLWNFFVFRMINEVLADAAIRDKLKSTKMAKEEGPESMLEFASLQEALGIKKGLINPSPAPPPGSSQPAKPATNAAPGKPAAGAPAKPGGAAPPRPATPK